MSITRVEIENFTVFKNLSMDFSPGINVFIGENGTGKTHLLKLLYSAASVCKTPKYIDQKIEKVFYPDNDNIGHLVKFSKSLARCYLKIIFDSHHQAITFDNIDGHTSGEVLGYLPIESGNKGYVDPKNIDINAIYIPVKEILSNSPGFRSNYALRETSFEEIYDDILVWAQRDLLKIQPEGVRKSLLEKIQSIIHGNVLLENEKFYLNNEQGKLEFHLLAEGLRKLALLWILIQNGTLTEKPAILFWDEPEANLNPKLYQTVVEILLELQRIGVQIFIATHDYIMLKEFDLQTLPSDKVVFHSLYKEDDNVKVSSTPDFHSISPNTINDTFDALYDRQLKKDKITE